MRRSVTRHRRQDPAPTAEELSAIARQITGAARRAAAYTGTICGFPIRFVDWPEMDGRPVVFGTYSTAAVRKLQEGS